MIGFSQFCNQFEDINHDDFSYEAKKLIYDYFLANDLDLNVDAIKLCTDYNESTWQECLKDFGINLGNLNIDDDIDDVAKIIEAFLDENTIVVGTTTKSIVYLSF